MQNNVFVKRTEFGLFLLAGGGHATPRPAPKTMLQRPASGALELRLLHVFKAPSTRLG